MTMKALFTKKYWTKQLGLDKVTKDCYMCGGKFKTEKESYLSDANLCPDCHADKFR